MPSAALQQTPRFTPLETRVIRLAASRRERRGRVSARRVIDRLAGVQTAMTLADPRLEALRTQAVRLRDGETAIEPGFLAAGYTPDHARTIAGFMQGRARRATPAARRERFSHAGGVGLALGSIAGFIALTVSCLV